MTILATNFRKTSIKYNKYSSDISLILRYHSDITTYIVRARHNFKRFKMIQNVSYFSTPDNETQHERNLVLQANYDTGAAKK